MRLPNISIFVISIMILTSCNNYNTEEREVIKSKIFSMYKELPDGVQNSFYHNAENANKGLREKIEGDSILKNFYGSIIEKANKEQDSKDKISFGTANFVGAGFLKYIDKELKLNQEEIEFFSDEAIRLLYGNSDN